MRNTIQNSLNKTDIRLLDFLSVKTQNRFLDRIMPWITHSNDFGEIYMVLALFALFWDKNVNAFICILTALLFGMIFGEVVIKRIVKRKRPLQNEYKMLINLPKSYSFPSGHTTSSFAVLGVVWASFPRYKFIILVLAALIAFSRLYLHVHYPTDVLGGIDLGIMCAAVTIWLSPDEVLIKNAYKYSNDILKDAYKAAYSFLIYLI